MALPRFSTAALMLLFVSIFTPLAVARGPHLITFRSSDLSPSSLAWDPSAQHFLVGSLPRPSATSVSDAGVLETIINDNQLSPDSSFAAIALDVTRRRLLVAVASSAGPSVAAYDLRSPRPHRRIFLSTLPYDDVPGKSHPFVSGVAVDSSTGAAYVTAADSDIIWKVDSEGNPSAFPPSKAFDGAGMDGIVCVGKGYLLAVQRSTGRLFKIDPDDGRSRAVQLSKGLAGSNSVAIRFDGSAVVTGDTAAWIVRSDDGWGEAGVYDKIDLGEGRQAKGVAMRDGRSTYVLHGEAEGGDSGGVWRIEEVESEREMSGEWTGSLMMVGLGLAVFLFWRFQMRHLVTNFNKKTA